VTVQTRGPHFAWWCAHKLTQSIDQFAGEPMALEDWQQEIFDDVLSLDERHEPLWASVAIVLPRKNGKTTMLAAYALYRLLEDGGQPEILLAAASDKQAGRLFDAVVSFVRQSPDLSDRLTIRAYIGEIVRKDGGGKILRMSSSPERLHGYNPSLVICDEVAQWRTPNLRKAWEALTTGGGARKQPQTFTISTAGEASERHGGILGRIIDGNEQMGEVDRRDALTVSRNRAGKTIVFNWSARTVDPADTKAVKAANPASWITEEFLARQAANPELTTAAFLQLHACVWSDSEDQWFTLEQVEDAAVGATLKDGDKIALGFDGSERDDATALIACRLSDRVLVPLHIWQQKDGDVDWEVPRDQVDVAVADAMSRYDVTFGYFDTPFWQSEIQRWQHEYGDDRVARWHTGKPPFALALERFRTDMLTGVLHHNGDRQFVQHIANARMALTRAGYKIEKPRRGSRDKIDAATAATLAYEACCDAIASGKFERRRKRRAVSF